MNNISVHNALQMQIKVQSENRATTSRTYQDRGAAIEAHLQDILANSQQAATEDTLEDLSLTLGTRLKELKTKSKNNGDNNIHLLEQLSEDVSLLGEGIAPGDIQSLEKLLEDNLSHAQVMLILASWCGSEELSSEKRKEVSQRLLGMMEENPDWALSVFSELELDSLTPEAMQSMRKIIHRFRQPQDHSQSENELWNWFEEIESWPQRKERIRMILQSLSKELSLCKDDSQYERLSSTIKELKKLLIFFGVEEQAQKLAKSINVEPSLMIKFILKIISQVWLTEDWFAAQSKTLSISSVFLVAFVGKVIDIIKFLPAPCFIDSDQRDQIIHIVLGVYDRLTEEEG